MCFDAGMWDGARPQTVEATDERTAAELVCGQPLGEGPMKLGELRAEAWLAASPGRRKAFRVQDRRS
jgi:hypothetical protein